MQCPVWHKDQTVALGNIAGQPTSDSSQTSHGRAPTPDRKKEEAMPMQRQVLANM